MITADYCLMMARYNRWMNERLYALLAEMPDDERKRDRSAFFRSIHGTLNHLLWGDRMWLGRFIDEPCTAPAFGDDMFADFAQLQREREITDQKMLNWAGTVGDDWFASTITYTSKVDGKTRAIPATVAAIHMFNHESHHRGQLTTLMKQAGCDPGITDLPWLPGVLRVIG